ncbi:MAG: CBS domain-containing protein [Candidatus Humimicrobiaceae bacterium]
MGQYTAEDIMNKNVIKINQNATVKELVKLLLDNKISGVPVVNNKGVLVGIVSKADLTFHRNQAPFPLFFGPFENYVFFESKETLKKYDKEFQKQLESKVKNIMTKDVKTVKSNTPISKLANIMIVNKINRIPVIDKKGKLVGIIARADMLKAIEKIL